MDDMEWYQDFFRGIALEGWEQLVYPERTALEVDFLDQVFQEAGKQTLLDIPCGFGRHAMAMSHKGYRMTGWDLAESFIAQAREESQRQGLDISWEVQNMAALDSRSGPFDGAYMMGNSFGYQDPEATQSFLYQLNPFLKSQAIFILETGVAAECLLPNYTEKEWIETERMFVLTENSYDSETSCLLTDFTFISDRGATTRTARHYVMTIAQIRHMLKRAGFWVDHSWGSLDRQDYSFGDPIIWFICHKLDS